MDYRLQNRNTWRRLSLGLMALTCCALGFSVPATLADPGFDLSSTSASHLAPASASATILVGGRPHVVQNGTTLTAAEALAAAQVASTGRQTLILGASGAATGGTFAVNNVLSSADLVIPRGVTALAKFDQTSSLTFGNLSNFGKLYAFSTNGTTSGAILANSVTNNAGGYIGSVLPNSLIKTIAGAVTPNFDLMIGTSSLTNFGEISSAGNLQILSNSVRNGGTISAASDLLVQSQPGNSLAVNNANGSISAGRSLNFQSDGAGISVAGGALSASAIHFTAPTGNILANVDRVDGPVWMSGCNGTVTARSGNLDLQQLALTADPYIELRGGGTLTLPSFDGYDSYTALSEGGISASPDLSIKTHGYPVRIEAGYEFDPATPKAGDISLTTYWSTRPVIDSRADNGTAGDVTLRGDHISSFTILADGTGSGNGGSVTLDSLGTGQLWFEPGFSLSKPTLLVSALGGPNGGNGGAIHVHASQISITNSGIAASATGGNGNGGLIDLAAKSYGIGETVAANGSGSGMGGTIRVRGGSVQLQPDGVLSAIAGSRADNRGTIDIMADGISIPTGAKVFASGDILLWAGTTGPSGQPDSKMPSGISVSTLGTGSVDFYSTSRVAGFPAGFVNAANQHIVIGAENSASFGVNVSGYVGRGPLQLSSLDLTDTSVVSQILTLQSSPNEPDRGHLQVDANGTVIGGNVVFYKSDFLKLNSENIPANVTATFHDYSNQDPLEYNITSASTTGGIEILGTHEFVGSKPSSVVMKVAGVQSVVPFIDVAGALTSDGPLTINTSGPINVGGVVQGGVDMPNPVTFGTIKGLSISGGDVNVSGSLISLGGIGAGASRSLSLTGTVSSKYVSLTGTTVNANSINSPGGVQISGQSVTLGEVHSNWIFMITATNSITLTGDIVSETGTPGVGIGYISAPDIHVVGNRTISITSSDPSVAVSLGVNTYPGSVLPATPSSTITFEPNSSLALKAQSLPTGIGNTGHIYLIANDVAIGNQSGQISLNADGGAGAKGGSVYVFSRNLSINGDGVSIATTGNADGGSFTVNTGSVAYAGGTLSVNGSGTGNGGTVKITSTSGQTTGHLMIQANGGAAGGTIDLTNVTNVGSGSNGISLEASGGNNGVTGNGGTITLRPVSGLSIDAREISVATHSDTGNGGSITVTSLGNLVITGADLKALGGLSGGDGGSIAITASGQVTATNGIDVSAPGGKGGSISVQVYQPQITGSLSANGNTGGTITLTTSVWGNLVIGAIDANPASSYIGGRVSADGAANQGGSVAITTSPANVQVLSSLSAHGLSAPGQVKLTANGALTLGVSGTVSGALDVSGTSVSINSATPLLIHSATALYGDLSILQDGGELRFIDGSTVSSASGNIVIVNSDAQNGTINIGNNSSITATMSLDGVGGNVDIAIGTVPAAPTKGTAPANVTVTEAIGGQVMFGANGFLAGSNVITKAIAKQLTFSTGQRDSSAIEIGDNVSITATTPTISLGSLDLTNPQTVAQIQNYQHLGILGGQLTQTPTAVIGTLDIYYPTVGLSYLNGFNIPVGVAVTIKDPINSPWSEAGVGVYTPGSNNIGAILNGTLRITGGKLGLWDSNDSGGPARWTINGVLTSDSDLSVGSYTSNWYGASQVNFNGTVQTPGLLMLDSDVKNIGVNGIVRGGSVQVFGCAAWYDMVVNNSGLVEATNGNILVRPNDNIVNMHIGGGGSGIWKAVNDIQFASEQLVSYRVGPGTGYGGMQVFFDASQKFLLTGESSRSVTLTAPSNYVTVGKGVMLDMQSPNTEVRLLNANLVNNGFINLHAGSGSHYLVEGHWPAIISNNTGSLDLSDIDVHLDSGATLYVVANGDISSSKQKTIDLSNPLGNGGTALLYAGYKVVPSGTDNWWIPQRPVYPQMLGNVAALGAIVPGDYAGSIHLSAVSIDTSGSASAGAVVAVSRGGEVELGAVKATGATANSIFLLGSHVSAVSIDRQGDDAGTKVELIEGYPVASSNVQYVSLVPYTRDYGFILPAYGTYGGDVLPPPAPPPPPPAGRDINSTSASHHAPATWNAPSIDILPRAFLSMPNSSWKGMAGFNLNGAWLAPSMLTRSLVNLNGPYSFSSTILPTDTLHPGTEVSAVTNSEPELDEFVVDTADDDELMSPDIRCSAPVHSSAISKL